MNSLTKKIKINAALKTIWAILADVTRTPEWVDGVKESERTGAIREGKGVRWRESCVLDRQHIEVEHEMTVWEPMKKAVIQSKLPMNGSMTRTLALDQNPEGPPAKQDEARPSINPSDGGRGSPLATRPSSQGGIEIEVEFQWDLGIAGMLLGEQKVRNILDQSFENTLANWKDLAEKK